MLKGFACLSLLLVGMAVAQTQVIVPQFKLLGSTDDAQKGHCFADSISAQRSDAYRCMVDNQIFDPCFSGGEKDFVVCANDQMPPRFNRVIALTKPLPKHSSVTGQTKQPWLVKLADGRYCQPYTGTLPVVNGKVLTYACSGKRSGGLSRIIPGKTWHAEWVDARNIKIIPLSKVWL